MSFACSTIDGARAHRWWRWAAQLLLASTTPAWAGNGLSVVGYGAESLGLGGADIASGRDTSAVAANPATLTSIREQALDLSVDPYHLLSTSHRDSLGNDTEVSEPTGGFAGVGYARRIGSDWVLGTGLFVQGGVGFAYDELDSGYQTRDAISSQFGIVKLALGAARQFGDRLSIGAALGFAYAPARQKYFPDTSFFDANDPEASFFGTRLDSLRATGFNGSIGLRYRPSSTVELGMVYRSKTPLDLEGGRLTVNYEALGQGRIIYREASLRGLAIAQDVQLGISLYPNARWLLAAKLGWMDWSDAVSQLTLEASRPDGGDPAVVAPSIRSDSTIGFRDQYVVAVGAEYRLDDESQLRAGYNYARQPTEARNLTPLLAVIADDHYMIGYGRTLTAHWSMDLAMQYQPATEVSYANPDSPITDGATEHNEAIYLHMMLSRRW